jgi:hypothetical protein
VTDPKKSLEELRELFQQLILDHGYGVHFGHDHLGVAYAYTVGRTMHGRPELLISGPFSPEHAEDLLRHLVELDTQRPFEHGRPVPDAFDAGVPGFPIAIDPWRADMVAAVGTFGVITALQLVWPDDTGTFPGDPDCKIGPRQQRVHT